MVLFNILPFNLNYRTVSVSDQIFSDLQMECLVRFHNKHMGGLPLSLLMLEAHDRRVKGLDHLIYGVQEETTFLVL